MECGPQRRECIATARFEVVEASGDFGQLGSESDDRAGG
jgi:hypothetical protein